ncbi:MAG TPA: PrsW family glutamic-type intramembrane protease [Bryobacteraceae bacterium]|nr:PrsW family glutamic-type intramembrane protease [Bryobacteraceae bacterium]
MPFVSLPLLLEQAALSLLPVLIFLLALELIDTYKLLPLRRVLRSIMVGVIVAVICYGLNSAVYWLGWVSPPVWARTGAALLEEIAKSLYIAWLLSRYRIGFMVDAAISGFAVGAGFALVENLTYIPDVSSSGLLTSAIRGLGTAMMHGGSTAIFGIVSMNLSEIRGTKSSLIFVPGLAIATVIHELYNQPNWRPVTAAIYVLVLLPVVMSYIFWRSEKALEKWLGAKLDRDIDLLQMMSTGSFNSTPAGRYMQSLENSFTPEILGDMFSYLQLSIELSARAKGDLLRREMGFPVQSDPELPAQLREYRWLEAQIGRTGKRALSPLTRQSRQDVWELEQLAASFEEGAAEA